MAVPFHSSLLFVTLAASFGVLACSAARDGSSTNSSAMGGAAADLGTATPDATGIAFENSDTLLLRPGQEADISVQLEPPVQERVDFAITATEETERFDGFLTETSVMADDSGTAISRLVAPSRPSVFRIRASVGELAAFRSVSVSSDGFGTVVVTPEYAGNRELTRWVASARSGTTCQELESLWQDGPISASGEERVVLDSIPVGPEVAVVVRQGQSISGCAMIGELKPGQSVEVSVEAMDRPIQLADVHIGLQLGIQRTTSGFTANLDSAIEELVASVTDGTAHDGQLLVQSMQNAIETTNDQAAFGENAVSSDFELVAKNELGDATIVRKEARSLFVQAGSSIPTASTFTGVLDFSSDDAVLELQSVSGVPASTAGFMEASIWEVETQPNDVLVLGGTLSFQMHRWLTAVAERQSAENETSPSQRLLDVASCSAVGAALAEAAGGEIYSGCSSACAVQLCEQAAMNLWARTENASSRLSSMLTGLTVDAQVDDAARLLSFQGSWVGTLGDGASASGNASGVPLSP